MRLASSSKHKQNNGRVYFSSMKATYGKVYSSLLLRKETIIQNRVVFLTVGPFLIIIFLKLGFKTGQIISAKIC